MTCWLLLEDDRLVDSGCGQWTVVGNVLDLLWCWPGKEMMWTWPAKDDVKSHQDTYWATSSGGRSHEILQVYNPCDGIYWARIVYARCYAHAPDDRRRLFWKRWQIMLARKCTNMTSGRVSGSTTSDRAIIMTSGRVSKTTNQWSHEYTTHLTFLVFECGSLAGEVSPSELWRGFLYATQLPN